MSRGAGKVERAISKAFALFPFKAFSVGELCLFAWPDLAPCDVKHKHRVSVRRAAIKVMAKHAWAARAFICGHEKLIFVGPLATDAEKRECRERFTDKIFAGTKAQPAQHLDLTPLRTAEAMEQRG